MRPAQKAPENLAANVLAALRASRFNEAGAKSAGKPRRKRSCRAACLTLQ